MYFGKPNPKLEKKLTKDLEKTCVLLSNQLGKNLISIFLIGGYGRDEGSFQIIGKKSSLVNDIDLVVITSKKIEKKRLLRLMDKSAKIVKLSANYAHDKYCPIDFHVDIFNFCEKELANYKPSQFAIDLKYAGKVIFGKPLLNLIPELESKDIPISDGTMILFNRILTLCEPFSLKKNANWIYCFSIKAILDSAVALLILNKKYSPFHNARLKSLKKLNVSNLSTFEKYHQKRFIIQETNIASSIKHWLKAKNIILQTLDQYLAKVYSLDGKSGFSNKIKAYLNDKRPFSLKKLLRPSDPMKNIYVSGISLIQSISPQIKEDRIIIINVDLNSLNQIDQYLKSNKHFQKPSIKKTAQNDKYRLWLAYRNALIDIWKKAGWSK